MKKFLLKISIFGVILIIYFGLNFVVNLFIIRNLNPSIDNKILIIGDSHVQNAINPKFLPGSINIAQTAEPYVLTYWKLKKILNKGTPEIIIVGFAPHNIAKFNDYKFSHPKWASEMFNRSYSIQEFTDIKEEVEIDYKEFYKIVFKMTCFYPHSNHFKFIGKFSNSTTNQINDYEKTINRHFYFNNEKPTVSHLSIKYIDSIVMLVSKVQKQLIFVNTPVYKEYAIKVPKNINDEYNKIKKNLEGKNLMVIDRFVNPYNDSLFLNSDHLNAQGAKKFTLEINSLLK